MKILIHTLIFSPDGVSTAYLYNDIAQALKERGHEVVVVTTTPHFNAIPQQVAAQPLHWKVPGLYKVSDYKGIRVYHVPQKKFRGTLLRAIGFLYWHLVSFFLILAQRRVDVILSPSPPLTVGQLNLWLGRLKHCRVIYNVQEIYPDLLGRDSGLVWRILSRMERRVYAKSDAVTTIDAVFHDTIAPRFKDPSRLHVIPNFVDTELYRPGTGHADLDPALFPETSALRLLYAGNIGLLQDWEPLVELARAVREQDISFFVIGEGARKPYLEACVQKYDLQNLHILPYQPRELMPQILDYSDLQFIFMRPDSDGHGFPSKVYTVMACARPLLICSGEGTPLVNFLTGKGCALLVTARDLQAKVAQMADWLKTVTRGTLREMGGKGIEEVRRNYSREVVTGQYIALIESLQR